MMPRVRFGKTCLDVAQIGLGGYAFGNVNRAQGWDPYSAAGYAQAIDTVKAALDAGINFIDTSPGYGGGQSELVIGEAIEARRDKVVLATKVPHNGSPDDLRASVDQSRRRLRTDVIDVLQIHGRMFIRSDIDHIVNDGILDAMLDLRAKGIARFIGFTTEESWCGRPLIATHAFDMVQLCYNIIYQSAARHALNEARREDMGVAVMRPLTSGVFQHIAGLIAPEWQQASDLNEVALKFVLSDSRVHLAIVGMRWPHEVEKNVHLAENFVPRCDIANVPRTMSQVYRTEDDTAAGPLED